MEIFIFFVGLVLFTTLVLPWYLLIQIQNLRQRIWGLERLLSEKEKPETLKAPPEPPLKSQAEPKPEPAPPTPQAAKTVTKPDVERQFSTHILVWIGGFALALAGFFLAKYSIEVGLMGPLARVWATAILGSGLLISSYPVRFSTTNNTGKRIAQSLAGAGIAVLYGAVYAAASLYTLLPMSVGLGLMCAVTVLAVAVSLRHGQAIALFALLGGFLTPALLSPENPSPQLLFFYLYALFTGMLLLIRRKGWWPLAYLAFLFAYLWALSFLVGKEMTVYGRSISIFVPAVAITLLALSYQVTLPAVRYLNALAMVAAFILSAWTTERMGFSLLDWGFYGILASAGSYLAYRDEQRYGFFPIVASTGTALLLQGWSAANTHVWALVMLGFFALYLGSSLFFSLRNQRWAWVAAGVNLVYYLLAYWKLEPLEALRELPIFWGGISAAFAVFWLALGVASHRLYGAEKRAEFSLISALSTTVFLNIALTIEVHQRFWPVALALQVFALSLIYNRFSLKGLVHLSTGLFIAFVLSLVPHFIELFARVIGAIFELGEPQAALGSFFFEMRANPLFHFGLPALAFGLASILFRRREDDTLVSALEVAMTLLFALTAFLLVELQFRPEFSEQYLKPSLVERGLANNALFLLAYLGIHFGRIYKRDALMKTASAVALFALARILYFELYLYNPRFGLGLILGVPVFNTLLLTLASPIFWLSCYQRHWELAGWKLVSRYVAALSIFLALVWVSDNVRFAFHPLPEDFYYGVTSDLELYSYSVAWLLLGAVLLLLGSLRKNQALRQGSLIVLLLTVGKVFLWDASQLEGLYRVFSFLGLGVSLLGLSYFYSRFVFAKK